MPEPVVNLMLDSGAFSAYTKGVSIDIDQYAAFALANEKHLKKVVNLDVINPLDVDLAAAESLKNFLYLKKEKGLLTLPVFHAGEHISYLDKMVEEAPWIGLSGSMTGSIQEANQWYETIFPHVCDSKGYPVANFHAFGDAVPYSLLNYPWYSADSTTWYVSAGLAGNAFLNGKYVR